MTLFEKLQQCGNRYDQYIYLGWVKGRYDGRRSGVMKKGNITYEELDRFGYGYEVKNISLINENDKEILFIELWSIDDK